MTSTVSELPLRRGHLADGVFAVLGGEILRGVLAPGGALPPERVLSERFGVSKLLVRQAVHRLAEAGLVEVRQGGATRVLDPLETSDIRIFELFYRLAPDSEQTRGLARDVLEKQFTQGLSLVEVFERRAPADARQALVRLVDAAQADRNDEARMRVLEERFWTAVADGCGNRILRAEVRWWYAALRERPGAPKPPPPAERWKFYAALARRLAESKDALAFYRETLTPGIEALFHVTKKKGSR